MIDILIDEIEIQLYPIQDISLYSRRSKTFILYSASAWGEMEVIQIKRRKI